MKQSLLIALLSLALAGVSYAQSRGVPHNAASDTWCRDQAISRGSVMMCWAYTFEQCMASRTSHTETCYLNPKYDPRFAEWRKRNPQY